MVAVVVTRLQSVVTLVAVVVLGGSTRDWSADDDVIVTSELLIAFR